MVRCCPSHLFPAPATHPQLYGQSASFQQTTFTGTVLAFTDAAFVAAARSLRLCPELLLATAGAMAPVMRYSILPGPARPTVAFKDGNKFVTDYGGDLLPISRSTGGVIALGSYASQPHIQMGNLQAGPALVHITDGMLMPFLVQGQ